MIIWIVSEGEPLPIDSEVVRLRRMGQLANILISKGHEVHWFSSTYHHYKKAERFKDDKYLEYKHNYFFHLLKGKKYKHNVSLDRIKHHSEIAKKFSLKANDYEKPNIIIATMAPLELSEAATNFAKSNKIPIVIDIRDLWPEIYSEVVPTWARRLIVPYINYTKKKLKYILNQATAMVGVTEGFLSYGLEIADRERNDFDTVFHTSYSIDYNFTNNLLSEWGSYGLDENHFIVSFMGNFGKQFEIDPLFEAAEKLQSHSSIKFVFCGVGANYEHYKEKAKKLDNVIMPGWIEGNQIKSLLTHSSIGIAPYKDSKNFRLNAPNKFGEYLSFGLPVFVSVTGEMEKLLTQYKCGIKYTNGKNLADEIYKLYTDEEKLNGMQKMSKQLFYDKFDSGKVYNEFADYLSEVSKIKLDITSTRNKEANNE